MAVVGGNCAIVGGVARRLYGKRQDSRHGMSPALLHFTRETLAFCRSVSDPDGSSLIPHSTVHTLDASSRHDLSCSDRLNVVKSY